MNAVPAPSTASPDFLSGGGEMGAHIRALDWSATPLGPPAGWPPSLRMMVSLLLANRFPMLLWWGPDYIQIYNDAYRPVLGSKHPQYLGRPVRECWSEVLHVIGPLIDKPFRGGPSTWMEDIELEVNRHGYLEESHFTIAYSPVPDETAPHGIGGVLATVHEITEKVIAQRRVAILSELAARSAEGKTPEEAAELACATLGRHGKDIAYAQIHLLQPDGAQLRRVCAVGVPAQLHGPALIDLGGEAARAPWPLAEALRGAGAQVAAVDGGGNAVLLPLNVGHAAAGVLVAGASTKIALDTHYVAFLELLAAQISTAISNAVAYDAERRRAEALAEIDRVKTAFFSNVSHEFRTPLTLILGPLEAALAQEQLPAGAREQLKVVRGNAQRLLKLVNSLLEFSRIEAGRAQARYQPTDLAACTRDLASMFRSTLEQAGLRLVVECQDLKMPVYVDRDMWEKIVLNLLSNAFKFTLEGEVSVRLRRDGAEALLEVADTGVGIASSEMPRLFERFHRIEAAGGRTQEGSGIGLALVYELVRLHGGSVEADSEPGRGTTLRVRIPLGAAHLPAEHLGPSGPGGGEGGSTASSYVAEAARWLAADAVERSAPPAPGAGPPAHDQRFVATFGARIVLADDNADMRNYVRDLLSPMYRIEAVQDGLEALAAAHAQRPDLILCDVMMPRLDGFGLLQQLRALPALREVPVIMLSARAGEEARIGGLDAGADDYLVKPFSARELVTRVGALLERYRSREAVRQRTAQFEALLEAAPLGVYLVDAELRIRDANPRALADFGSVPDLIGRDFGEVMARLWPAAHAARLVERFRHTLESGEPYSCDECTEARLDAGDSRHYEWQIHRIPLPGGGNGVVCYFRDVSSHVRARLQLETADRQKNEFLAMLAHELRNPMAPIRNVGELLSRALHEDQRHTVTSILQRQVGVLTRLVDDLLDVSRITQGRIELKRSPVQVAEIVSQAVETVQPLLTERGHHLAVVSHGALRVRGDVTRLVQCVVNLLSNSAKYTKPGGEIRVESQQQGSEALITVTDNGAGITPELLPYVFDLFVQSHRTLDRSQGGLGIGLSLVKRLVEMHGGHVSAASPGSGGGATFEIRLPLSSASAGVARDVPLAQATPRRILIIDDNADAADSLGMLLQLEGHAVDLSYDAREALQRIESMRPDVVLLDIGLPHLNGYDIARSIRARAELKDVRLVALTGYGQAEDRQRAREAGFDEHLVKPVDPTALRRALGV